MERLFAWLIDEFIFVSVFALMIALLAAATGGDMGSAMGSIYGAWLKSFFSHEKDFGHPVLDIVGRVLGFALRLFYFALFESSAWQATPGKRMLKLKVMDEAGYRISFGLALWRYLCKFLSALILGIGFLMVIFTRKKQGLHDMMAGTLVCGSEPPEERKKDEVGPLRFNP